MKVCQVCGSWHLAANGRAPRTDWKGRYTRYYKCRVCATNQPFTASRALDVAALKKSVKGRQVVVISPGASVEALEEFKRDDDYMWVAVNDGVQVARRVVQRYPRPIEYVVTGDQLWAKRYEPTHDVGTAVCLAVRGMKCPNRDPWVVSPVYGTFIEVEEYHGNESGIAALSFAIRANPEWAPVMLGFTRPINLERYFEYADLLEKEGYPCPDWQGCHEELEELRW